MPRLSAKPSGSSPTVAAARSALRKEIRPGRAATNAWFFKTGPGDYGEGDKFLGVAVPNLRKVAREFRDLSLARTVTLLQSPWHEDRLLALVILVGRYERGTSAERKAIARTYLANTHRINNWDLVDCSAAAIIGAHTDALGSIALLRRLARSRSLWERRIAIIATHHFTKDDDLAPTFEIAERLINDRHDLIQKAVGWMLREAGHRDLAAEMAFLDRHCTTMPRTALRYAIERFPEARRKEYLARKSSASG